MEVEAKFYAGNANEPVIALVPTRAKRILDVGCGAGVNAAALRARGAEVDGITLSPEEAEAARHQCGTVYVHDLESGLPTIRPQSYDAVICSHMLEHIRYPARLLHDIHAALKPSGVLVVALPNLLFWKNRLKLIAGRFEYTESGIMDNTHFRWYTFATARRLLEAHGFVVVRAEVDGGLPLSRLRRILPDVTYGWADAAARRLAPGLFGSQLLYVARPAAPTVAA